MLKRYRGVVLVFGAILVALLGGLSPVLQTPGGWLYDFSVKRGGWREAPRPSVLLVEYPPGHALDADAAARIVAILGDLGAAQVIFLTPPEPFAPCAWARPGGQRRLVVGVDWPLAAPSACGAAQSAGALVPPLLGHPGFPAAEAAVHRRAATQVRVDGREYPTLAAQAAANLGLAVPRGDFWVNFNVGADWLPRIDVARLLAGGAIAELVAGRSVVVGPAAARGVPGLYTPLDTAGVGLSAVEFQAYAIDTLARAAPIRTLPRWLSVLVLIVLGLFSLVVYQSTHLDRGIWFSLFLTLVYLGGGWLLLHGWQLWAPVAEFIVTQWLIFALFLRFKLVGDDERLRGLVLQRVTKLQNYMLPPDFYQVDEHWQQVIAFIDQVLNLRRAILLEKVEGDHRVREVQALRCSLADIDERRRDFERSPYREAIAAAAPTRLHDRLFFKDAATELDQYLVPLLYGGEVQGFWAFEVDPRETELNESVLGNVRGFGIRIAELLYHRRHWREQRERESRVFARLFRLDGYKASAQELSEILDLIEARLQAVQAVFDGLGTAAIHYDLFGRVVQLNSSMERFLRTHNVPGQRLTALDLLVALTGTPARSARAMLQQVVVDKRESYVPVVLGPAAAGSVAGSVAAGLATAGSTTLGDGRSGVLVHVRPLLVEEGGEAFRETTTLFGLAGILFEVVGDRARRERHDVREELLEWFRLHVEQDLAQSPAGEGAGLARIRHLHAQIGGSSREAEATPLIDPHPALLGAIADESPEAARRNLQWDCPLPRLMSLVRADAEALHVLVAALLEMLIADAAAGSTLKIAAVEQGEALELHFENAGFGLPDSDLQAFLWSPEHAATEEFQTLRAALPAVAQWGGALSVHSEVGSGIWARLRLRVAN